MAKKEIKPRRLAAAEDAEKWREAFVRYLRSECHLAENSVVAYERDLRRFFEWLRGRRIAGLGISELSDYPAWLTAQQLAPASISRHTVSLKVFFRYLQLEGVLAENEIIDKTAVMDSLTLPAVKMPAHDKFVPDDRKGVAGFK